MEHLTPDQRSVTDQLHELRFIANEHGMYDAADWLERKLRELEGLRPLRNDPGRIDGRRGA